MRKIAIYNFCYNRNLKYIKITISDLLPPQFQPQNSTMIHLLKQPGTPISQKFIPLFHIGMNIKYEMNDVRSSLLVDAPYRAITAFQHHQRLRTQEGVKGWRPLEYITLSNYPDKFPFY